MFLFFFIDQLILINPAGKYKYYVLVPIWQEQHHCYWKQWNKAEGFWKFLILHEWKMPRQFMPSLIKIRSLILALISDTYAIINFSFSVRYSPYAHWAFCVSQISLWSCLVACKSTKSVYLSVSLTGRNSAIRRFWLLSLFVFLIWISIRHLLYKQISSATYQRQACTKMFQSENKN